MFNTFEQNTFDFVATLDKYYKGNLENVIEIDVKKNVLDRRLKDISMDYILYDTSVLSYDYICNVLDKHITVTMATNWDGDGNNTNVATKCRDDRLGLEFGLTKSKNELSSLDRIIIKDDKIYAVLNEKASSLSWQKIQEDLSNTLNVKTYTIHMNKPASIMKTFKEFLQIPESATKIQPNIVGRITDVKRSGDWLQLQAMEPLDKVHKNMVLYTVDTPLAARSLLKKRISIVTNKRPGKDTVNVRIVGNVQANDAIVETKRKELNDYTNAFKNSWIVKKEDISPQLQQLADIINGLLARKWNKVSIAQLDNTLVKKDLEYNTFPVERAYHQKQNEVLAYLINMYVTLSHLQAKAPQIAKAWQEQFESAPRKPVAKRRQSSPSPQERAKIRRGGAGSKDDFMTLLQRTQAMKTFFAEYMNLNSMEHMFALSKNNLEFDLKFVATYLSNLPDAYTQTLFQSIENMKTDSSKLPLANTAYSIMMELHELSDLVQFRDRNVSFKYGRTEVDYDRFATAINKTYTETIMYAVRTMMYTPQLVNSYLERGFPGKYTIKTLNTFVISLINIKKGGASPPQLDKKNSIIIAHPSHVLSESPFVRTTFARPEYFHKPTRTYRIPVTEYFIAILIRDMFFERFKHTCFDAKSPCHYAPRIRQRTGVRSAPTAPERSIEREQVAVPLSASFHRPSTRSHRRQNT
jgi:hypothetical protein